MPLDKSALSSIQEIDPDGRKGLIKDIVKMFTDSIPGILSDLKEYHLSNDTEKLATLAHRFKSSCHSVGATDVALLLAELEIKKLVLTPAERELILFDIDKLVESNTAELQELS